MVLGRQEPVSTAHGMDYTVNPIEGLELSDQLHDAVKYIHGTYQEAELPELGEGEAIDTSIPADPNVKNYSYAIVDGKTKVAVRIAALGFACVEMPIGYIERLNN